MKKSKNERSEILLVLIMKSDLITIEGNNALHIDQKPLDVKVYTFLYSLQQPTKKISIKKYTTILNALDVSVPTSDKKETSQKKWSFFHESKNLDQLYLKGRASYGSVKTLQAQSKLPLGKVQYYLETKPSFTKYRSNR